MPFTSTKRLRRTALALLTTTLLGLQSAHALDNDADDYSAGGTPAGTNLMLVYYQHAERDRVRANGQTVANGTLDSDIGILRMVRFVDIFGLRADPQILLPFGRMKAGNDLASMGKASGVGDAILAATIWLVNKPEEGEFFGITPGIYLPTGKYDRNSALNLGENRWKLLMQAGWSKEINRSKLALQLSGDVTIFGKNDEFGAASQTMKQKPLYQLQAWLRQPINESLDVRLGAVHFNGGRTKVDGVYNDDRVRTTNMRAGVSWNFAPSWNLTALYGRDLKVHNGLQESNRLNLRLLHAF